VESLDEIYENIIIRKMTLPSNGVSRKAMGKGFGIDFPSVVKGKKGFKILTENGSKDVIIQFVVWSNPNPNHKCVA
jgi:hypothetical protein